jgi:hypothetical protein
MIPCTYNFFGMKRCRFEPRYDEHPATGMKMEKAEASSIGEIRKMFYFRTYVQDVCVSCGKVRRRDDDALTPQRSHE